MTRADQDNRNPRTGAIRQPAVPVPPAFYPGSEDATALIQRITDEAVQAPASGSPGSPRTAVRPARGAPGHPPGPTASAGMKTERTAGVVRAGALMAVATVVSRFTGLLSKIAIAAILGDSIVSSSYTLANTLPNIVFELLIGGVLTSVAIPLLTRAQRDDADGGAVYTQRLLSLAVVALAVATVLAVVAAPLITRLYLSGGSKADPVLATDFALLLLPQIFFYGLAALFGAILNTKERFAANAWAPVLNNVIVLGVAVLLAVHRFAPGRTEDHLGRGDLLVLGIGTTAGIVAQAVVMWPSLRRAGFRWRWRWGWDPRFTEAGGLLGWAVGYVLVSQVGVVVTLRLASDNSTGGILFFQTASLIFQMPYGILGVAVLTAIMPRMSRHAAAGELAAVKDDMSLANRLSIVTLLPVSAGLIVLGSAVVTVLYRHGSVDLDSTLIIGVTLGGMAIGLVPLAMTLVQMRVFYAMKDGRTPTLINAVMVAVRVPLLLFCVRLPTDYVIAGLAASTAASYLVGAVVGELWLRARFGPMGSRRMLVCLVKMAVASAVGGAAAFVVADRTVGILPTDVADALLICLVAGSVGLVVIAGMALLLRVEELLPLRRRLLALVRRSTPMPVAGTVVTPGGVGFAGAAEATAGVPGRPAMGGSVGPPRPPRPSMQRPHPVPASDQETVRVTLPPDPASGSDGRTPSDGGSTVLIQRAPVEFAPGATVGGRYRLAQLIGIDSAGNHFWRAKDTVLPRDMAVTLLPDTQAASATVARTLRVGRLHHIGLPQTLDVGTEQGQSYVVGQWVDGATLTDLLSGGPLEADVAASITAKVSEAVAEAHRNGIALGAINPTLVRVNFDGQVRLSHVIAHGNATPDQDIRAIGGLLYLMLTGSWPLSPSSSGGTTVPAPQGRSRPSDPTVKLGTADAALPAAPTRLGREVPAKDLRPGVPEALSALADRALHPDEPDGIHAVGAIATLLRAPDIAPVTSLPSAEERPRPSLSPNERRIIKERRVKLSVAFLMLATFATLIIIVVASLAKQLLTSVAGTSPTVQIAPPTGTAPAVVRSTAARASTTARPSSSASVGLLPSGGASTAPTSSAPPAAQPVRIVGATVYDPKGDGNKDFTGRVARAFDGDPSSFWPTFEYNQQFPTTKPGVGLTLELEKPVTAVSVQITSDTLTARVEVRSATGPDTPLEQTQALGSGVVTGTGPLTIPVTGATPSKYLVVWFTQLAPKGDRYQADLNEVVVTGR